MQKDAPANIVKLRVRIGPHEFEAEGPIDVVAGHFKTWQQLIATRPLTEPSGAPALPAVVGPAGQPAPGKSVPPDLFTVDAPRKLVALRWYPGGRGRHADAALLLLYGHRLAFGDDGHAVEVTRLKAALAASGHRGARVDRTVAPHVAARFVRKAGRRRGSTYELTTVGLQRAEVTARALRAAIPSTTNAPETP